MKLVGLMAVRNEDWILNLSLRVALLWCDEVVLLDHASTDRTRDIAMRIATATNRVTVVCDDNPAWDEMRHRQAMLELARVGGRPDAPDGPGATHIAIIDADEVLTANLLEGEVIRYCCRLNQQDLVQRRLELPLFNLRGAMTRYHANGVWGDRWATVAFQDAARLGWSGDRFHAREPEGQQLIAWRPGALQGHQHGGVLHFWGASERRLIAKHALYKMTEALRWPSKPVGAINAYYDQAIYADAAPAQFKGAWSFATIPPSWLAWPFDWRGMVDLEAAPWQEAECKRLVMVYGRERFNGLDLFGVV